MLLLLKLAYEWESPGDLVKTQILIQQFWNTASDSAFRPGGGVGGCLSLDPTFRSQDLF